jgi:hypothetical protein
VNNVKDASGNNDRPELDDHFRLASFLPIDIGNPSIAGTVTGTNGGYRVTGGAALILVALAINSLLRISNGAGDFDLKVRVQSLSVADAWTKATLMARETLSSNSVFAAAVAAPPVVGSFFEARTTTGGSAPVQDRFPPFIPTRG